MHIFKTPSLYQSFKMKRSERKIKIFSGPCVTRKVFQLRCSKTLMPIRPKFKDSLREMGLHVTKHSRICSSCHFKLCKRDLKQNESNIIQSVAESQEEFLQPESDLVDELQFSQSKKINQSESSEELITELKNELIDRLNVAILPLIDLSPIDKKKMRDVKSYSSMKLQELCDALKQNLEITEKDQTTQHSNDYDELINRLKIKFLETNCQKEKYKVLSLLPASWSPQKMQLKIGCSIWMARTVVELRESKGILAAPDRKRSSNILDSGVKEIVDNFYIEDDISSLMPGKNDYVSMLINGEY